MPFKIKNKLHVINIKDQSYVIRNQYILNQYNQISRFPYHAHKIKLSIACDWIPIHPTYNTHLILKPSKKGNKIKPKCTKKNN